MASSKGWPALLLRSDHVLAHDEEERLAALLDDFGPTAIQDLTNLPLPPGGLWDPSFPPPPEPPPSPLSWRVFFTTDEGRDSAAQAVRAAFSSLSVSSESVDDEDWAAKSQKQITAIRAGRFVVAPPWDVPSERDASVIIIEPSRGFGTGHHASTRLCLRALSEIELDGKRAVDLGTGSGVLAMAAIRGGAKSVIALDIDPDAIDSARESARLNPHVEGIRWLVADYRNAGWDALSGGPFDVVMANLTGGMLIASAARIRELIVRNGLLVCSGFDEDEAPAVETALALPRRARYEEDRWVAFTLRAE